MKVLVVGSISGRSCRGLLGVQIWTIPLYFIRRALLSIFQRTDSLLSPVTGFKKTRLIESWTVMVIWRLLAITWLERMGEKRDSQVKWKNERRRHIGRHPLCVDSKKMIQMNLLTKQKDAHRLRDWTYGCWGWGVGTDGGVELRS